ncbi:MAG: DUF1934 domain-containing protein [Oscillospiraceae bacterium]|nr:DUF1934 domain-containing protein [Oscillospiraceae bacterium]
MKQDVIIEIKSLIEMGGDSDKIEVTTRGHRFIKDGTTYISYKETDENGFDGNSVLIKVEGERRVTVNRLGSERSQLLVEAGRRNICSYATPHGTQTLGITGGSIRLSKDGLSFNYELDINNVLMSKNQLFITIKECAK